MTQVARFISHSQIVNVGDAPLLQLEEIVDSLRTGTAVELLTPNLIDRDLQHKIDLVNQTGKRFDQHLRQIPGVDLRLCLELLLALIQRKRRTQNDQQVKQYKPRHQSFD